MQFTESIRVRQETEIPHQAICNSLIVGKKKGRDISRPIWSYLVEAAGIEGLVSHCNLQGEKFTRILLPLKLPPTAILVFGVIPRAIQVELSPRSRRAGRPAIAT